MDDFFTRLAERALGAAGNVIRPRPEPRFPPPEASFEAESRGIRTSQPREETPVPVRRGGRIDVIEHGR